MKTLRNELRLKIDDLDKKPELKKAVWDYFWFLRDHMAKNSTASFIHALDYF